MPPQSQIAASGLVMFSGFYPPAMQVFTLSVIRHRRGFLFENGNYFFCLAEIFSKTLTKSSNYIQYIIYIFFAMGWAWCVLFQVQQEAES